MSANPKQKWTVEEYLANEETSEFKHEFYNGEIFAMAGASEAHNVIVANILASLHVQLRKKPCRVYPSDLRVRVNKTGLYTYPDVTVICGDPKFTDDPFDVVTNPILLVEVLSPTTEDYDRGGKFEHYSSIESLQEYIVIAQDKCRVEHRIRQGDEKWLQINFTAMDAEIQLKSIDCTLLIEDMYEKVSFEDSSSKE